MHLQRTPKQALVLGLALTIAGCTADTIAAEPRGDRRYEVREPIRRLLEPTDSEAGDQEARRAEVSVLVERASAEHIPSDEELRTVMLVWVGMVESYRSGQIPYFLLDPEIDREMRSLLLKYPTFFEVPGAVEPQVSAATRALITTEDDFSCDNNCIPSASLFITIIQESVVAVLQNLSGNRLFHKVADRLAAAGESYLLTDDVRSAALAMVSLESVLDMAAITADVVLIAAAVGAVNISPLAAGILAALAAGVAYASAADEIAAAYRLFRNCRDFRNSNCSCAGSACVCAQLGAPCPGTGPELDSTCCGDAICVVGTCQEPIAATTGGLCGREQARCDGCCRGLACRPVGSLDAIPSCCARADAPCNSPGDCCGLMECRDGVCQGKVRGEACQLGDCIGSSYCADGLCV